MIFKCFFILSIALFTAISSFSAIIELDSGHLVNTHYIIGTDKDGDLMVTTMSGSNQAFNNTEFYKITERDKQVILNTQ